MKRFLERTKSKILETNSIIEDLKRKLKLDPDNKFLLLSIESYKKVFDQLQSEYVEACSVHNLNNIFYRLFSDTNEFSISGITDSLRSFQNIFSISYEVLKFGTLKESTRLRNDTKSATSLIFDYSYNGSLGIAMSAKNEQVLLDSKIDEALNLTLSLLDINRNEVLTEIIGKYGFSIYSLLLEWTESNLNINAGVEIDVISSMGTKFGKTYNVEKITSLHNILKTSPLVEEKIYNITNARLVGIDIDKRIFNIKQDENHFFGTLDENIDGDFKVPDNYTVSIRETILNTNGKIKSKYHLLSIKNITD